MRRFALGAVLAFLLGACSAGAASLAGEIPARQGRGEPALARPGCYGGVGLGSDVSVARDRALEELCKAIRVEVKASNTTIAGHGAGRDYEDYEDASEVRARCVFEGFAFDETHGPGRRLPPVPPCGAGL
jgi:hypothetical protein